MASETLPKGENYATPCLDMITHYFPRAKQHFLSLLLGIMVMSANAGCATSQANPPTFAVNHIYDVSRQKAITFDDLLPQLLAADVIYIGEEHYTPSHLEAAQTILNALLAHDRHPALAMEMFSWDGQSGLDRYIQESEFTTEQMIKDSQWNTNWGGEFADYQPLVNFAKSHKLQIFGLNPPRPLVRLVATKGLTEALQDPEMRKWPIQEIVTDNPAYEQLIFEQIEACHPGLPKHVYRRIFEASIFRDEGMAQIIANYLNTRSRTDGPLVSYTGGGHIQYKIPVPKRVERKHPGVKSMTIYLEAWDPSKEQEVRSEMQTGIADFLWLTPLGPKGLQPRCG
ncbi:MAG: ChaN family lipoprotein [Nitrospirales bacterium]|nr:ChaN family lipoprotein [Nitrospirales bacterium]